MPHVLNLQIADICMQIHFVDMFVTDDYDTAYNTFLNRSDTPLIPDINLFLLIEKLPAIHDMKKIFDSEQSWSMFRQENNYFITLQPPFSEHPFWVARMNQNATEINVYCGDEIIHTKNNKIFIENPLRYPMDQIILMYYLSRREGALLHAAGIGINKNGYIFAGRSGAGKTTISRQFITKNYQGSLSDDRVIVRKIDNKFRVFGTPWPGEGGIASNTSLPLSGIFFLSHGDSNRIEELNPQKALEKLLPVVSIPWYDPETMTHILSFCETLISHIPTYTLHFRPDTEVVDVIEKFIPH